MSKITVSEKFYPHIIFDSEEWKDNNEYDDVAVEIIEFIKKHENVHEYFLIQNKSYCFGDTMSPPIIMVNRGDFGGLKGTLKTYIKDIVYDLIPEDDDEY
jgi:hypothetical protein